MLTAMEPEGFGTNTDGEELSKKWESGEKRKLKDNDTGINFKISQ